MFNGDFYPTPKNVIEVMLEGEAIEGKTILEPSAGSGNIVDYLKQAGAGDVLTCEIDHRLKHIAGAKGRLIAEDFLTVKADQISHVNYIIMNPPFSRGAEHINHAFNIAPPGCRIVALCNYSNIQNTYSGTREELKNNITAHGNAVNLGAVFSEDAERKTGVEIGLIRLQKPASDYSTEFEGFFLEEDEEESTGAGLMPYNVVRDLVNRYCLAVRIYDKQLQTGIEMSQALGAHFGHDLAFTMSTVRMPTARNEFKKSLQKAGWQFIFSKMNLEKYSTKTLREDINKFVEHQKSVPFTMRNIYRMLEIVAGTTTQRMDKAIVDVFDKLTSLAPENKHQPETWKTNGAYLLNKKFIINHMCPIDKWSTGPHLANAYGGHWDFMEDLCKALCYITGEDWEQYGSLQDHCRYEFKIMHSGTVSYYSQATGWNSVTHKKEELEKQGIPAKIEEGRPVYGQPFKWAFFNIRAFKKGTMHFEFLDQELCDKLNARVARIKGWALPEKTNTTKKAEAAFKRQEQSKQRKDSQYSMPMSVLFEMDI